MLKRKLLLLRLLLASSDLVLLNFCLSVGLYLSNKYVIHSVTHFHIINHLIITTIWILTAGLFRLYEEYTVYKIKDINRATWRSIVLHVILFTILILLTSNPDFSRNTLLIFYSLVVICFALSRLTSAALEGMLNFDFDDRKANILAIASIGGHWIELLRFMPLFAENNVTFISNKSNLKDTVKGHKFHIVSDANKDEKLNLIKCTASVFWYVIVLRPQVIITTGAAPGLLGILMGRIFGAKTIWVDSIANAEKLSLSGCMALKIADRVYTQWEHLSTPHIMFSGNVL